jgi:hypothetical protein
VNDDFFHAVIVQINEGWDVLNGGGILNILIFDVLPENRSQRSFTGPVLKIMCLPLRRECSQQPGEQGTCQDQGQVIAFVSHGKDCNGGQQVIGEKSRLHSSGLIGSPRITLPQSPESQNETDKSTKHGQVGNKNNEQNACGRPFHQSQALYAKSRNKPTDDTTADARCQSYRCRSTDISHHTIIAGDTP